MKTENEREGEFKNIYKKNKEQMKRDNKREGELIFYFFIKKKKMKRENGREGEFFNFLKKRLGRMKWIVMESEEEHLKIKG